MLDLETAIKHCEEVAHQNEILMKRYDDASGYSRSHNEKIRTNDAKGCEQLIFLYRQLAEWLKALKEIWDSGDCNDCLHSKNCTIRPKLGQMVRYNCYQYERKIQNDNDND